MPILRRAIRTRDVVFMHPGQPDEKEYSDEITLRQLVTVLDINNLPASDEEIEQALHLPAQRAIEEAEQTENLLVLALVRKGNNVAMNAFCIVVD